MMETEEESIVTVCIITYNHKNFIAEAIESVLQQKTNFAWHILIADDCSTDGTSVIVRDYALKNPGKIKLLVHEKNVGMQQNLRDLVNAPVSKYMAFLDGDDIWVDPQRLQKQVDFLETYSEYAMVYGKYGLMNEKGTKLHLRKVPPYKSGYIFKDILLSNFLPPLSASLLRTEVAKEIYKTGNEPGIDFYIMTSITKNHPAAYIDEEFFCYRINAGSITNTQRPLISEIHKRAMLVYEKEYPREVAKGLKNAKRLVLYLLIDKNPHGKYFTLLLKEFDFSLLYFRQLIKYILRWFFSIFKNKPAAFS